MNFKILCSDLDGTLLSSKNDVSEFTVSEVNRIKDRMRVVLVSARMPKSMRYLQQRMGIQNNPLICYNGALILENGKQLFSQTISVEDINTLNLISKSHKIKLGLYSDDEWCVGETSERVEKEIFNTKAHPTFESTETTLERWNKLNIGAHKIMLMGTKTSMDAFTLDQVENPSSKMNFYRSNETLIEVAPKATSKLIAIEKLLQSNESLDDVIAFGDNYNDLDMLKSVGLGVAVANARQEIKEIAKKLALSNKEDGVAQFIKDHL